MKYRILLCLITIGLLITACGGTSTPADESTSTAEVSEQASTANTPTSGSAADVSDNAPPSTTSTPTQLTPGDLQLVANCTVVSRAPTPGPTEESLFPPVTENDWTFGPEDADVTFIEYSDFQ